MEMGAREQGRQRHRPFHAATKIFNQEIAPVAYDCVKFVVVRSGQARLLSNDDEYHVAVGDIAIIGPNTLCGAIPQNSVSATTVYLNEDYVLDQLFWQHADKFITRRDVVCFIETHYPEPIQLIHFGERAVMKLSRILDELACLSEGGNSESRFHRFQALLSIFLDEVVPTLKARKEPADRSGVGAQNPAPLHPQVFRPTRPEARSVAEQLRRNISRRWTLSALSKSVHLSESQLRRVFIEAYGKTPAAFLTILRTDRMADLLRQTDLPISRICQEVGWEDPAYGSLQFRRRAGVNPQQYRRNYRRTQPAQSTTEAACSSEDPVTKTCGPRHAFEQVVDQG